MKTEQPLMFIPDFMIVLKYLENGQETTNTDLHYSTRITYAHLHRLLKIFSQKGWTTKRRENIHVYHQITKEGLDFVKIIDLLLEKLGIDDKNILEYRKRHKRHGTEETVKQKDNEVEVVESGGENGETY